jgi:hypothetical protein
LASIEIRDIAPELLEELERKRPGRKQVFSTEAMEWVVGLMQIKPGNGINSLRDRIQHISHLGKCPHYHRPTFSLIGHICGG